MLLACHQLLQTIDILPLVRRVLPETAGNVPLRHPAKTWSSNEATLKPIPAAVTGSITMITASPEKYS
jgi:hypothetical protein